MGFWDVHQSKNRAEVNRQILNSAAACVVPAGVGCLFSIRAACLVLSSTTPRCTRARGLLTLQQFALIEKSSKGSLDCLGQTSTMSPPSTLRTANHTHADNVEDLSHTPLDEDASPSLQQLIRLQIFTPMTLLLALGANLVTAFAFHPTLGEVNDQYETIWSARKELVGGYLLLVGERCTMAIANCFLTLRLIHRCTSSRSHTVYGSQWSRVPLRAK